MKTAALLTAGLLVAPLPFAIAGETQISNAVSEAISVGEGGYTLNFSIQWSCDDAPQNTASAPGRIDLIDANGNLVGQLIGSASGGNAAVSVTGAGAGSVSGAAAAIAQTGAGGTPANGSLNGTWNISGVAPGAYTLNLWSFQEADPNQEAGTIWTSVYDAGGGGPVAGPAASAPPAPPSPPSIVISAPASAMTGQSISLSATATQSPGGNPLQTVILEVSTDGGNTWTEVAATPSAANPTDTEGNPYSFSQPGNVSVRAMVYDTAGLTGTANQTLVVNAPPPPPIQTQSPPTQSPQAQPPQPQPPQPPSATIWADNSSITFGQATTIHAVFVPGANDSLSNTNIDSPEGTPAGPDQDGSPQTARDHPFTPASVGSFTFFARINTPNFPWATYGSVTVNVALADQSGIAILPAVAAVNPGQAVTFSATGGATGNYAWGGAASGAGPAQTVVFPALGTSTVSVQDLGDANYNPSPNAIATISVIPIPVTFAFSGGPAFSFDGTPKAIAVSANPANATFVTGGTYAATAEGNYAASAQATGNYTGSAMYPWSIGQPAVSQPSIVPATAVVMTNISVPLEAVGGATGNYVWGGAATGFGPLQFVAFANVGTYVVTVYDSGDATHPASGPASATVTVQPSGYTLSVTSTPGGTAIGGGFYEANTMAIATATPDAVDNFAGWTGDLSGTSQWLLVYMDSDKSVMAHFSPMASQVISAIVPPSVPSSSQPIALPATSTSGLPVVLTLVSGPGTLSGNILTLTGAPGTIQITATQPGNGQFLPAPPLTYSFAVTTPPAGVWTADDSAQTKKNDKDTRNASFLGGAATH